MNLNKATGIFPALASVAGLISILDGPRRAESFPMMPQSELADQQKTRTLKKGYPHRAWNRLLVCALITLLGCNIRTVTLAVPPLLPLIQHDLTLSYTAAGLLTALPILIFGGTAWFSGRLIERIGGRIAVTLGLVLLGTGALLRGFLPTTLSLYFFTALLSAGIILIQTALPWLMRSWSPSHIGLMSALLSDGMMIGEAIAAGTTIPLLHWFLGAQNWQGALLFWSVPVLIVLPLWLWLAPPSPEAIKPVPPLKADTLARGRRLTGRVSTLHMGIILGTGSLIYFGMNSWIAAYNLAMHQETFTPLSLTILNAAQLPISLIITPFAQRLAGRRAPFVFSGVICAIAVVGWVAAPAGLQMYWVILLGGCSSVNFTLGIVLPSLLGEPEQLARLTGTILTINYCLAFIGPFIGGWLWDGLHLPATAFLPVLMASIILAVSGIFLPSTN